MANSNKPVAKFRAGTISCAVFENTGNKDGVDFSYKTIQVQRSYKVGEEWKNEQINLRKNDVANLQLALNKAFEEVVLNKTDEKSE